MVLGKLHSSRMPAKEGNGKPASEYFLPRKPYTFETSLATWAKVRISPNQSVDLSTTCDGPIVVMASMMPSTCSEAALTHNHSSPPTPKPQRLPLPIQLWKLLGRRSVLSLNLWTSFWSSSSAQIEMFPSEKISPRKYNDTPFKPSLDWCSTH